MPTVPVIADVAQRLRDRGVVDLAGTRLAAARHVGDLDLADGVAAAPDQLDEVPLADLRVVQVEHHLDVRMGDALDERQRVLRAGQRHAGMVDDGVEVLHAERDARRRAQFAEPLQVRCAVTHISPVARYAGAGGLCRRRVRRCAGSAAEHQVSAAALMLSSAVRTTSSALAGSIRSPCR